MFINQQLDFLLVSNRPDSEKLDETFRQIHTFKGLFSQLDFLSLPVVLHQLEDQLKQMQDSKQCNPEQIKALMDNSHCQTSLRSDIDIIEGVLGKGFLNNDKDITLNLLQVQRIESFILDHEPGPVVDEVSQLLKDLMKSRLVNIKSLFRTYPKSSEKLALAFDKSIYPFEITGKDLLVDANQFAPFTKTLIHVFRNAIDHGIETPDERVAAGKNETGTISCDIKTLMEFMVITICDDGKGLDLHRIRETAVSKGLFSRAQVSQQSDKKLTKLIFDDRFSTKPVVTTVSGRGLGLSAVRSELRKLRGDFKISTTAGEGTMFQFVIPYDEDQV
jgi:two-component system chemotaxis sensor kinase CheA